MQTTVVVVVVVVVGGVVVEVGVDVVIDVVVAMLVVSAAVELVDVDSRNGGLLAVVGLFMMAAVVSGADSWKLGAVAAGGMDDPTGSELIVVGADEASLDPGYRF